MRKLPVVWYPSLILLGILFRFSYLSWGYPYFFHPDENNITSAILQMNFRQLNPHFFAYGGLPIYTAFLISSLISLGKNTFPIITYTLRFISASLSLLLLPSLFYIGRKMYSKKVGIIAAALAIANIGFIQFAHFGTFEMWLSFFTLWFFYYCYLLYQRTNLRHTIFAGFIGGILLSIKVSSAIFIPLPILLYFFNFLRGRQTRWRIFLYFFIYCTFVIVIYSITNPYLFLDTTSFIASLSYESSVALGTLPVFYTQSFLHTIPVIFQLQHVLPFLLNPIVFIFSLYSFIYLCYKTIKEKGRNNIFLLLFFLLTFLSQALLFVKWTRYMVPVLPFVYLMIAVSLSVMKKKIMIFLTCFLFITSLILGIYFLFQSFASDSRIQANIYVAKYLKNAKAIVEPYDLGAVAFTNSLPSAQIINLYSLDTNPTIQNSLYAALQSNSVFISPSQRLIHTRLTDETDFPKGNTFYKSLVDGLLSYHMVYQTPCTLLCQIIYLGNPVYGSVEETATVFDHPFVTVFAKQ